MRISDWSSDVCSSDLRALGCARRVRRPGCGQRLLACAHRIVDRDSEAPRPGPTLRRTRASVFHGTERTTCGLCSPGSPNPLPNRRVVRVEEFGRCPFSANLSTDKVTLRSEEHPYALQSLMRPPYPVFCLKTKKQ